MVSLDLSRVITALCSDLDIDTVSVNYILSRHQSEGIKFLTEALPRVSKTVIMSLEMGFFDRKTLTDFRFRGATLVFMQSLLNSVFCNRTGVVLTNPCPEAIRRIRQLCEYFYKLAISLAAEKENEAIESFLQNELELKSISHDQTYIDYANDLRKDFETYYPAISRASASDILSAHRPRSTSGTYVDADSMYFLHRESTSARQYPHKLRAFEGYFKPYPGAPVGRLRPAGEPVYSELLLVPKDSRGPRTICRETLKRLETQMSYFDFMIEKLTSISKGAINFLDQEVNRNLARSSSVDRKYATLDLKDASDRVSHKLISTIFRNSPGCSFFLKNVRATSVKIGDSIYPLHKVAGMGSGLTFPTMSLLASLAICHEVKKRFNFSYDFIRKDIFIYGDDIIVPSNWYECAQRGLIKVGLKVNVAKSFIRSHFRESCGADFLNGSDVTIVRLKLSNSKPVISDTGLCICGNNDESIVQIYEHSKECYDKNLTALSFYFLEVLRKTGVLTPGVRTDEPLLVDYSKGTSHLSYDMDYQVYSVSSKKMRAMDERVILSKNGRLARDPYKYLGSFLKRTSHSQGTSQYSSSIVEPTLATFAVLTIPRSIVLKKKKVPGWVLKEPTTLSRPDFLLRRKVRLYSAFARAFVLTHC